MRHHLSLAAVVAACALAFGLVGCSGDEPEAVESPTAVETSEPEEPTPELPPAGPVEIAVDDVETQLLDSAVLKGEPQREPSAGVVDGAVGKATAALEAYLNAQFIDPDTRFSSDGLSVLLEESVVEGLSPEQRQGLGELDVEMDLEPAGPVATQAVVLTDGDELLSVTLAFDAPFTRRDGDGGTVRQSGQLLFNATQEGEPWRASMADLTVELPEEAGR